MIPTASWQRTRGGLYSRCPPLDRCAVFQSHVPADANRTPFHSRRVPDLYCVSKPYVSRMQVYYFWNEVGRTFLGWPLTVESLKALSWTVRRMVCEIAFGQDATFHTEDPLPFLGLHGVQLPVQLLRIVQNGTPWLKLDMCSGKVVELGGD